MIPVLCGKYAYVISMLWKFNGEKILMLFASFLIVFAHFDNIFQLKNYRKKLKLNENENMRKKLAGLFSYEQNYMNENEKSCSC